MTTPAPASTPSAATPAGLAIASLIAGIAAAVLSWVPIIGLLAGLAAVVLGILALRKGQSKVPAIIGIVLGGGGALVSLFFTIAFIGLGALAGNA